jgi:hypothetical protein
MKRHETALYAREHCSVFKLCAAYHIPDTMTRTVSSSLCMKGRATCCQQVVLNSVANCGGRAVDTGLEKTDHVERRWFYVETFLGSVLGLLISD